MKNLQQIQTIVELKLLSKTLWTNTKIHSDLLSSILVKAPWSKYFKVFDFIKLDIGELLNIHLWN